MPVDVLCIGGANVDSDYRLLAPAVPGTSNPATVVTGWGGVARNVADILARLGTAAGLVAAVGDDAEGEALVAALGTVDASAVRVVPGAATARYTAVLDPVGELVIGVNAMRITDAITPDVIAVVPLEAATLVFAECNLAAETLASIIGRRRAGGFRLAVDAISVPKSHRLPIELTGIDLLFCNRDEAAALVAARHRGGRSATPGAADAPHPEFSSVARDAAALVARGAAAVVVTAGALGHVVATSDGVWSAPAIPAEVVDVTGAGDARIAGTLAALLRGTPLPEATLDGTLLAALAVEAPVVPDPRLGTAFVAGHRPRLAGVDLERIRMTAFDLEPEIADALAASRPVVALESTILTHGMPHPQNLEMAQSVEAIIRAESALPATIAVVRGRLRIGLPADELDWLARQSGARKLSRADLAFATARGLTGGTTVAATMMGAALAGIRVFATGGIGGVHQGAESTFDESADLLELARTPVVVVSAGAKAILDIPKTLERLETLGVPVVAYGTDAMPAFWSRDSGLPAPLRLDSPDEIAAFERARDELGAHGGLLVANPVPAESEIPMGEMAGFIAAAIRDAAAAGVSGMALTPYLLQRELELTAGRSLTTNIALVESNARLAARIAVALAR